MSRIMPQVGEVVWIGIRPARREPLQVVESVFVSQEEGLQGDHFSGPPGSNRQVTLIQAEHVWAVAQIMSRDAIDFGLLRRNVVVSGINLQALKECEFQIGQAVLFGTGDCPPCSRMEENLGPGGYNAMRGHGGITAKVVRSGIISTGSSVLFQCRQ